MLSTKYKSLLSSAKISTPLRLAHFMTQLEHESGLKPISENLNYSAKRMLEIFKHDFDTNRDKWLSPQEKEKVRDLIGHPDRIANFVYANQNGNGNEASKEGWKFRGRGFIQITCKNNYIALSKDIGIDYVNNPDLLLTEADSMISAIWFWNKHNLNKLADQDKIREITRVINGGYNGLDDRIRLLDKYKKLFGVK